MKNFLDSPRGKAGKKRSSASKLSRFYLITVLQEIPDPRRALLEAKRVLKADGKLAVTEFLPDPDYSLASTTVKLGQSAGFELDAVQGNLWTYTARFRKPVEFY